MDRRYQLVIENKGGTGKNNSPIAKDQNQSDSDKGKGLLSQEGAKAYLGAFAAYTKVKSFADQIYAHEVSLVELRTGSKEAQDRANFTREMVTRGVSFVESGMMTALVTGNVAGFAIGAGLSLTQTLVSYALNQDRINTQRTVENQSIQLNYIRAGARGSRGAL